MRYLNKLTTDQIVVGVSVFIITACSALLYADYASRIEIGNIKQIGTITYKKKVAQRKYSSQVIWEDLEQNVPVYNNDSIRTADESEAIINLSDGTKINVDENSLILLAFSDNGINIDFSHGSISANRGEGGEGGAENINIKSKDAVVSLDKGDVTLSTKGEQELDVTVTDGKAEIKTGNEEKILQKDQKATVSKDAGTKIVTLKLKLLSPPAGERIITAAPPAPVNFSWEAIDGGTGVFLEIARDSGFTRGVAVKAADGKGAAEQLAEGSYYWRIRALNVSTNAAEYSDVRKITVIREQPTALLNPLNNETIVYSIRPPIVNFRWRENALASDYILEISRDPSFARIERSVITPLTEISVDPPGPGTYYWRIKTRNAAIVSYRGSSAVSAFTIEQAAAAPPILIAPSDGKRISASMTGGSRSCIFSWSAESQVRQYEFALGTDREMRTIAVRERVSGNLYGLRENLRPGEYYWRVGIVSKNGSVEALSAPRVLVVVPVGSVVLGEPRVTGTAGADSGEKTASVRFSWIVSGFKGTGRIDLARDRSFLNMISSLETTGQQGIIDGVPAGAYYWRVRLFDDDRSQIAESDHRLLYLSTAGAIVGSADEIVPKKGKAAAAETEPVKNLADETGKKEREELLRKEEELAQKKKRELARIQEEEAARRQQEELARKREDESTKKRLAGSAERKGEPAPVLVITSSVRGSAIYADSRLVGYDTVTMKPKPEERVLITVKAAGFTDFTRTVTLKSGETKRIDARLVSSAPEFKEKRPGRRLRWRTNLTAAVMSKPVYRNNSIVAATKNGFLVGLNAHGGQIWRTVLGSAARSTPAVDDKAIYVVTVNSILFCVDARNGAVRWKKPVEGPLLFGAGPVIDGDRVFVATSYGVVQAFAQDGTEVWRRNLEEGIFSSMTCDNGVLYVGTDRSKIYAISTRDGGVKWTFGTDGRVFSSSPRVYNGIIYVGCYSGTFYAISRSGWLKWKFRAKKAILSAPAFFGNTVIFGSEDGVAYALDAGDGTKRWEFNTGGSIIAGPDISQDQNSVLIPSGSTVFSLDVNSGELNWKEGFASGINTPVTIVGNAAFVGLNNGDVVSLSSL